MKLHLTELYWKEGDYYRDCWFELPGSWYGSPVPQEVVELFSREILEKEPYLGKPRLEPVDDYGRWKLVGTRVATYREIKLLFKEKRNENSSTCL